MAKPRKKPGRRRRTPPNDRQMTIDDVAEAAWSGDYNKLCRLLTVRANVNDITNGPTSSNPAFTPFGVACSGGHVDCVRFLIENGANVKKSDDLGNSPLHHASEHGQIDVVRLLL